MQIDAPQCVLCANFDPETWKCKAFKAGIPQAILTDQHDHNKPFPGDNGIQFSPLKNAKKGLDYSQITVPKLNGDPMPNEDEDRIEDDDNSDLEKASDSDLVRQLLRDENDGMTGYSAALEQIQDPKLKEIMQAIQEDEQKHSAALEQYLQQTDPDSLEDHEDEESPGEESLEDDEGFEGEDEDTTKDESSLADDLQALLDEHNGETEKDDESDEDDLEKDEDQETDPDDEDDELDKEDEDEAVKKSAVTKLMPIVKLDNEQHKAYCIVTEPNKFDLQGDRSSEEEVEKAAHRFMKRLQKTCSAGVGVDHERPIKAYVIENVVTQQPGIKLGKQILAKGTWYQGHDLSEEPEIWKAIKSGEITGLSRQGEGNRVPVGKGIASGMSSILKAAGIKKEQLNDLKDEDIDRIDWVGKAANGRRIAIIKFTGSGNSMKTRPAGAKTEAAGAEVEKSDGITKADIEAIVTSAVSKAVEPLQEENAQLRKAVHKMSSASRDAELESIAKSHLSALGPAKETVGILKSVDKLPSGDRKAVLKALKQANAVKKDAMKILSKEYGHNRPIDADADSAIAKVNKMAQSLIEKSDKPMDISVARTKVYKMHPELRQQVLEEQKEERGVA